MEELEPVNTALVVTPHPDDAEFGCAGTAARLISEGKKVYYVVTTNGDKGGRKTDMTAEYLINARQEEQKEAAKVIGVSDVVFLPFGDGELEDNREVRGQLVYYIRKFKPDIVFTTDPFRSSFYIHRDHRITGLVTLDAVFPYARDLLHFPEHIEQGLDGHNVDEIFFWGSENPDTFIDVSSVIDLKIQALLKHKSQMGDYINEAGGEEGFAKRMKEMGRKQIVKYDLKFEHAEMFRRYGIRRMLSED